MNTYVTPSPGSKSTPEPDAEPLTLATSMSTIEEAMVSSTEVQSTLDAVVDATVSTGAVGTTGSTTVVRAAKTPLTMPSPEAAAAPMIPARRATAQIRVNGPWEKVLRNPDADLPPTRARPPGPSRLARLIAKRLRWVAPQPIVGR